LLDLISLNYHKTSVQILDSKVILSSQDGAEESVLNESLIGQVDDSCVLYCERFMEFLIDMLSQLPTRRYVDTNLALPAYL